MYKLWISLAAAAMFASASPAYAQLSTASSRKAEQQPVATTGTMHDHVERAEDVLNQLLRKRNAGSTNPSSTSETMIAVQRTQLERLESELNAVKRSENESPAARASSSATPSLDQHIATARSIATSLANQPAASASQTAAAGADNSPIVVVDRAMLKELQTQVESIENLAKQNGNKESR